MNSRVITTVLLVVAVLIGAGAMYLFMGGPPAAQEPVAVAATPVPEPPEEADEESEESEAETDANGEEDPQDAAVDVDANNEANDEASDEASDEADGDANAADVQAMSGPQTRHINALYYATSGTGDATGGVSPVRIEVRPASSAGDLRVGIFEEEVGGTGNMWRASGWMAVVAASQMLGIDPREYEFSFSVGGRIDGPSAGTYMTVGVLAAILGHDIDPNVAMTGTMNPDGTVGPVGGIPQKIQGAAAQDITLVLVPAGSRYDTNAADGQLVDVVDFGRREGVEVREVSTVFEAYELITGARLPRPPTATTGTPQLPGQAFDRTRAKAQEWYARYESARARIQNLSPDILAFIETELSDTDETARRAENAMQQGLSAVAYQRSAEAAALAELWLLAGEIVERYATAGPDSAINYLQASRTSVNEMNAVIQLLRTEQPRTVSDYASLFDAYANIGQAQGLVLMAEQRLEQLDQAAESMTEDELLGELVELALLYNLAQNMVQLARDSVDLGFGHGETLLEDDTRVEAMSQLLRRAADANISYFESTVIDEYARQHNIHPDQMRQIFMGADTEYLLTVASDSGVRALASQQEPHQVARLNLGNSISSYTQSASLVAKYYSLNAQVNEYGGVTEIGRERALVDMLDLADQRARELINVNGDDAPVMAVLYYENARLQRQGSAEEQMYALQSYWRAATLAQIQAYLAGIAPE